jgi:nucleotide-binding universal stress UspA family protein
MYGTADAEDHSKEVMKNPSVIELADNSVAHAESFQMKTILAPIDFSQSATAAFRYATHLAEKVGSKIVLLNVVEGPPGYSLYEASDQEELAAEAQHKLDQSCQSDAVNSENVQTMVRVAVDSVWEEIIEAARQVEADLIVLPAHDETVLDHLLFGDTVYKVVRHAPCPVLVVPPPQPAA